MKRHGAAIAAAGALLLSGLAVVACGVDAGDPTAVSTPQAMAEPRPVSLTLGDIEPYEPAWRIKRILPLAQLLAERLEGEAGAGQGRVTIARDIEEMSQLMRDGTVDLLLDSPHPVLAVQRAAGGEILLQREVSGATEYVSVFIARVEAEINSLRDLDGRVLALQERHSTSGFLLPVLEMIEAGLAVREVSAATSDVGSGEVGFYFTRDEENTVEAVISGAAIAGAVSSQDWDQLPEELRRVLREFHRTPAVPRQLVLARAGLSPARRARLRELLLGLEDADRRLLESQVHGGGWVWRFSDLTPKAVERLASIERRWAQLPGQDESE